MNIYTKPCQVDRIYIRIRMCGCVCILYLNLTSLQYKCIKYIYISQKVKESTYIFITKTGFNHLNNMLIEVHLSLKVSYIVMGYRILLLTHLNVKIW